MSRYLRLALPSLKGKRCRHGLLESEARDDARPCNCSLSDLSFPFFAALSREGLGFGFPPGRIGSQHLLGRSTHSWVDADDETLLGEHGFFRYRPDCLQVFLAQRLHETLFKVAVQRRERRQRLDEDPGVRRHARPDAVGKPVFFRNPCLLVPVNVKLADLLHLVIGSRAQQIGKLYVDGYKKAGISEEYWLAYSVRAGMPTDTWIFIEALPSLAALDRNLEERFMKAVGEENLQKIGSISKEAVLSEESFIVGVDPTVSRPTKEMLAANPSWWKAKTQPFAAKGREERKR